jgi:CspA family cold shock protein
MTGRVKKIEADKGFGFIQGTDNKSYFFHRSALKNIKIDALEVGQDVEFEESDSAKGPRADDVFVS